MSDSIGFYEMMADEFNRLFPLHGKCVLEIGADPYLKVTSRFLALGAHPIASNLPEATYLVPERTGIPTLLLDARRTAEVLGKESIDAVFGLNILEHLHDFSDVLRSIFEALRPGGCCYLHGYPIWTSSFGHHAIANAGYEHLDFGNAACPIPPWGHLYMSREELAAHLAGQGLPQNVAATFLDWVFDTQDISRRTRRQILRDVEESPFLSSEIFEVYDQTVLLPEILDRIKTTPWWDSDERFDGLHLALLLKKF